MDSELFPYSLVAIHVNVPVSPISACLMMSSSLHDSLAYLFSWVEVSGAPSNSHVMFAGGLDLSVHLIIILSSTNPVFAFALMVTEGGPVRKKINHLSWFVRPTDQSSCPSVCRLFCPSLLVRRSDQCLPFACPSIYCTCLCNSVPHPSCQKGPTRIQAEPLWCVRWSYPSSDLSRLRATCLTLTWVTSTFWVKVTLGSGIASGKGWVGTWPVTRLDPVHLGYPHPSPAPPTSLPQHQSSSRDSDTNLSDLNSRGRDSWRIQWSGLLTVLCVQLRCLKVEEIVSEAIPTTHFQLTDCQGGFKSKNYTHFLGKLPSTKKSPIIRGARNSMS